MSHHRAARVKLLVLLIVVCACAALGAGAFGLRAYRREAVLDESRQQGQAAYERGDYDEAARLLGRFVGRRLDDLDVPAVVQIVKQYADALLRIEPVEIGKVRTASAAYRRLLRDGPFDPEICVRLALIYRATGDAAELEYIAGQLRARAPDDPRATIWLAQAWVGQRKTEIAVRELQGLVERVEANAAADGRPPSQFVDACIMLAALSDDDTRKREWYDRAVNAAPDSAAARAARARFLRNAADEASADQRQTLIDAAIADLERAEACDDIAPLVRLGISSEWLLHGRTDRAAAQLATMREVPEDQVRAAYLDPEMWRIDRYRQSAALALTTGELEACLQETESLLPSLSMPHHRLQALPAAIEVLVASGRIERAQEALDTYNDAPLPEGAEGTKVEMTRAYLGALVALAAGRPYAAIETLEPSVRRRSVTPSMRALLARAYQETGQHGRAASLYASVDTTAPHANSVATGLRAVQSLLQNGRVREALNAVAQLERQFPERVELKLIRIRGEALEAESQTNPPEQTWDRLAAELEALLVEHPDQAGAWALKAILAQKRGRGAEAERVLVQAVERSAASPASRLQLARFYAGHERFDEADAMYRAATEAHSKLPTAWLAYAEYLVKRDLISDAKRVLQSALEAVDSNQRSEIALRLAALELTDPQSRGQGIDRLRSLAAADPGDVRCRSILLRLDEIRQDHAEAHRVLDEIKAIEGEETGLTWRIAQAQLEMDSLETATPKERADRIDLIQSLLTYCITADPARVDPVLALGRLYEQTDDAENAERAYRRYLRNYSHPLVAQRLVVLLEQQRRFAEARTALEEHWALFDPAEASRRSIALSLAAGDLDRALSDLQVQLAGQKADPAALLILARLIYARTKDAAKADQYVERALAAGADPIQAIAVRLSILRADGRADEAVALAAETVRTHGTFDAHLLQAELLRAVGQSEAAEAAYKRLPGLTEDARGYRTLGEFYGRSGRLGECIQNSRDGLKVYADDLALRRGLIKALVMRNQPGDREQAASELDALGETLGQDADLTWVKAMLTLQRRGPDAATQVRALLRQAIEAPPTTVEAYEGLTNLAMAINDSDLARGVISRAERVHGKVPSLRLARARLSAIAGDPVAATAYLREAIATDPLFADAYAVLAPLAAERGDTATLRSILPSIGRAEKALPANEAVQIALSQTLAGLGRTDEAIARLTAFKDSETGARSVPVRLRLAGLLRERKSWDAAKELIDEADALGGGGDIAVRVERLRWLQGQSQHERLFEEATAVLQAAELSDQDIAAIVLTAQMLQETGQSELSDNAVVLYEKLVERQPKGALPLLGLALARYQRGEISDAISAYRRALERAPNQPEALNNLAWILCEKRQEYEEAMELSIRAVELAPNEPVYRDTLGTIMAQMPGKLEGARSEFAKAVELSPSGSTRRARGMLKLGRICLQLHDHAAAEQNLAALIAMPQQTASLTAAERAELNQLLERARRGGGQ